MKRTPDNRTSPPGTKAIARSVSAMFELQERDLDALELIAEVLCEATSEVPDEMGGTSPLAILKLMRRIIDEKLDHSDEIED